MKKNIIILNVLILFTSLNAKDTIKKDKSEFQTLDLIERVEPPNWWVGMKTRDLQLLIYGDSISYLQPKIENRNIKLKSIEKVDNKNYIFLNISVLKNAKPGDVEIKFYNGDNLIDKYDFALKSRESNAENIQGFNTSDVMYLITPDRYSNGDPSNDDVEDMRERPDREDDFGLHGGDIKGIIDNLDYIKEMGFTTVWLNPVLENNMERASYHERKTCYGHDTEPLWFFSLVFH